VSSRRLLCAALAVGITSLAIVAPAAGANGSPAPSASGAHPEIAPPSRTHGATTAGIVVSTEARSLPGGGRRVWRVEGQTGWSAEPQVLLVLASAWRDNLEWVKVLLPIRPDGSTGWIPRNDVRLAHTSYWIAVDKRRRMVRVYRSGSLVRSFQAVIGKPATPTPTGLAAVYEVDRQPDPEGFLGTWALPLTILSHALFNFGGGPGRIAIHGRGGASLLDPLGSARSHGCIRVDDTDVGWLAATIRQGTPVEIAD
jgi:lipoprotein-anchoring transpeptidase ErfK/SrfK